MSTGNQNIETFFALISLVIILASCGEASTPQTDTLPSVDLKADIATFAGPADMKALATFVSSMCEGRTLGIYRSWGEEIVRTACLYFSSVPGQCDVYFVHDTSQPWAKISGGTCEFFNSGEHLLSLSVEASPGEAILLSGSKEAPTVIRWSFGIFESVYLSDEQIGAEDANHLRLLDSCL